MARQRRRAIAKVKLELEAGKATPAPPVGTVTREQLRTIAEIKIPDLNAGSIEAAMKVVEGTAGSMGVRVGD